MDLDVPQETAEAIFRTASIAVVSWSCSPMQQCNWAAENCSGRFCHRSSDECELCRLPQPKIIAYFSNISKSHTMRFLLSELTCAGDADEKQRFVIFTIFLIKVTVNSF